MQNNINFDIHLLSSSFVVRQAPSHVSPVAAAKLHREDATFCAACDVIT